MPEGMEAQSGAGAGHTRGFWAALGGQLWSSAHRVAPSQGRREHRALHPHQPCTKAEELLPSGLCFHLPAPKGARLPDFPYRWNYFVCPGLQFNEPNHSLSV